MDVQQESTNFHRKINLLAENIIDQIKAGEVVEGPTGLLKELIENSLDAKATKISIHIKNNCLDLLSISDNGCGMTFDDLPLAFARHATSKIDTFSDLYKIYSFGFRGEALAAISSVSHVTCTSFNKQLNDGGKIIIEGGRTISQSAWTSESQGTHLIIKNLFFNTPARLKFIRSKTSEKNSLKKLINAFLLAYPEVEFSITWDDENKVLYPKLLNSDFVSRIKLIFFKQNSLTEIHHVQQFHQQISINAFFSDPLKNAPQAKKQFIFVNQRFINDKGLHQSVIHALDHFWGKDQGHYVLFVNIPPELVDVNVHPNKIQVKFENPSLINSLVYSSLKKKCNSINTPKNNLVNTQSPLAHLPEEQTRSVSISSNPTYSIDQKNIFEFHKTASIAGRFLLLSKNNSFYFFDQARYFSLVTSLYFELSNHSLNEKDANKVIPIMIGKMFDFPELKKKKLIVLQKMNIEIEQFSPYKVVLRGLHPFFYKLIGHEQFIEDALVYLNQTDKDFSLFLNNYRNSYLWLSPEEITNSLFNNETVYLEKIRSFFHTCILDINSTLLETLYNINKGDER